jgi:type VI secretion system protein VasG
MAAISLKALFNKLNTLCQQALSEAVASCKRRRNDYVELEHWLLALSENPDADLRKIYENYNLDPRRVITELTLYLDKLRRGSEAKPGWALGIEDGIRETWVLTSLEYNWGKIRSGALLAAILNDRAMSLKLVANVPSLAKLPPSELLRDLKGIVAGGAEDELEAPLAASGDGPTQAQMNAANSKTPNLDQFTTNLTERAQKGEIDPVIGRDFEIRQVIDILTRRRQNNPILTGEAGVGKTAVVEGFALRVVAGDVPPPLKGVAVRVLDLGLLQAGAGVKGEFENRLKGVISEVKASPQPIIMFIDEAHTIIGAGGAAGSGDAANLLKPALARGELRTIAATTWMEYKKYFEEDPALKRRFQVVKVEEPDIEKASRMLRGVAATLEKHHKVRILDEAVEDAVKLSHRYITDRQLPDKAVSLLDTACARVGLSQSATPAALEDTVRDLEHVQVEIGILQREKLAGEGHDKRLAELEEKKKAAEQRKTELEKQLVEERKLVTTIQSLRTKIEAAKGKEDSAELVKFRQQLHKLQGETPLVHPVVDRHAIAAVVSGWTGIPVGKMVLDEIKTVLSLRDKLEERVIGQSHALEVIAERMRTARAQLLDPKRPIGVFMLVGPSGVGKTETAMALSDILYGGSRNLVVINMSEYKEDHKVSRLTGSAPGYVGYGQGGVLTEAVRRKPYSIVLLDEVEKANVAVQEIFYQVFDKGTLQDDRGSEVDFKNTIILLTSNVGTDTIMKVCADPDTMPDMKGLAEALRPDLLKSFKPALLGRITIVPYFPLGDEVIRKIIGLQMKRIGERMQATHGVPFEYTQKVLDTIAGRCKEVESGARNVDQIITGTLLPSIAGEMLKRMAEGKTVERVKVDIDPAGAFAFSFGG